MAAKDPAKEPDRVDAILLIVDYAQSEAKRRGRTTPADILLEQWRATKSEAVRADLRDALHLIRLDQSLGPRGAGPGMSMGL